MLKKLIKAILKYPIRLLNHIYTHLYYKTHISSKECRVNHMAEKGDKVLVFSPHVDDETIGLGATLLKYKGLGNQVSLVYLTDGGGSTSNLSRKDLIDSRKREGEELKDIYGLKKVYFLNQMDGSLDSQNQELVSGLVHILKGEEPTIIYTPFLLDGHRDHMETTRTVMKALSIWRGDFDKIYMYEVNCPINPMLINTLSIMDKELYRQKGEIYNVFISQWAMDFDVFNMLDRKKRFLLGDKDGYGAEVFIRTNLNMLVEIDKELERKGFKPKQFRQLSSHYNLLLSFIINRNLKGTYNRSINRILSRVGDNGQ